jgi:hypothetical protein
MKNNTKIGALAVRTWYALQSKTVTLLLLGADKTESRLPLTL